MPTSVSCMPSSRGQEARQRHLELRIGKEEDALAGQQRRSAARRACARSRAGAVRSRTRRRDAEGTGGGLQPQRRALGAERKGRRKTHVRRAPAARAQCPPGTVARAESGYPGRPAADRRRGAEAGNALGAMPSCANRRRNWSSTTSASAPTTSRRRFVAGRQRRHERGEAGVLALGEGGLDAAAGIIEDPHLRRKLRREPLRGARQVELDDLGGAGADQEQQADIAAPLQQPRDHAIQFGIGIGHAGEVTLFDDRGGEARLGEDHHAGGRLDQVRAGAGADHQEERVLDLAMQPHDSGQAAEDRALAALATDLGAAGQPAARLARGYARQPLIPRLRPGGRRRGQARLLQSRRAQLDQELRRVDDVGRSKPRARAASGCGAEPAAGQRYAYAVCSASTSMLTTSSQKNAAREQVAPEDVMFPDRAGDHDGVEHQVLSRIETVAARVPDRWAG